MPTKPRNTTPLFTPADRNFSQGGQLPKISSIISSGYKTEEKAMIHNLTIHNFRCFQDLALKKTTNINIISSKNGVGKTTLLESIFLLFGFNNPNIFLKINSIRNTFMTSSSPDIAWEHFFYLKNIENKIYISSEIDGIDISIQFEKDENFDSKQAVVPIKEELHPIQDGYPLKSTFHYGDDEYIGHIMPLKNNLMTTWSNPLPKNILPIVQYLSPNSGHLQNLVYTFGKLEKAEKKGELIKIFKTLDKDLEDFTTIFEDIPRLYAKKHGVPLLPLSVMGNGLCKLIEIVCAMLNRPNSIILIDEIETGFHYKFLFNLWKIIEKVSIENNIQVFATTHSFECIQAASDAIENKNNITYIRIGKNRNSINPFIFDGEELEFSIEHDMEIR